MLLRSIYPTHHPTSPPEPSFQLKIHPNPTTTNPQSTPTTQSTSPPSRPPQERAAARQGTPPAHTHHGYSALAARAGAVAQLAWEFVGSMTVKAGAVERGMNVVAELELERGEVVVGGTAGEAGWLDTEVEVGPEVEGSVGYIVVEGERREVDCTFRDLEVGAVERR